MSTVAAPVLPAPLDAPALPIGPSAEAWAAMSPAQRERFELDVVEALRQRTPPESRRAGLATERAEREARRADEAVQHAQQEAQRAEQEAQRARQEAQRAEQETQRAEAALRRLEEETRRAEAALARAAAAEAALQALRAVTGPPDSD